jgi:putative two-component system response regulator
VRHNTFTISHSWPTEVARAALESLGARLSCAVDDHATRVGQYVQLLALKLGLSALESAEMGSAALLHDLGKIGLPDSVLRKPEPLDAAEWEMVKKHPLIGASLLSGAAAPSMLSAASLIALTHHERWDGSGYPHGLKGGCIPLAGRITTLADQYDALRCRRPYKAPFTHGRTCGILLRGDGRTEPEHFDPRVLSAFRDCQDQFRDVQRCG